MNAPGVLRHLQAVEESLSLACEDLALAREQAGKSVATVRIREMEAVLGVNRRKVRDQIAAARAMIDDGPRAA